MIKAAIFDLDHTLFDRYATLAEVAKRFRTQFEVADGVTDEQITKELVWADKQYVHFHWRHIHKHLVDCGLFSQAPSFEEYRDFVVSCFFKIAIPFDFAIPMLEGLRKSGIKTGLITNGNHDLQYAKINLLGLQDSFDSIIATGDIGVHKPERGPFDIMAARLQLDSKEMLYIGDNPLNDVEGARLAGYIPVWVKTTGTWVFPEIEKPELQVETVEEIPALIKKLNNA